MMDIEKKIKEYYSALENNVHECADVPYSPDEELLAIKKKILLRRKRNIRRIAAAAASVAVVAVCISSVRFNSTDTFKGYSDEVKETNAPEYISEIVQGENVSAPESEAAEENIAPDTTAENKRAGKNNVISRNDSYSETASTEVVKIEKAPLQTETEDRAVWENAQSSVTVKDASKETTAVYDNEYVGSAKNEQNRSTGTTSSSSSGASVGTIAGGSVSGSSSGSSAGGGGASGSTSAGSSGATSASGTVGTIAGGSVSGRTPSRSSGGGSSAVFESAPIPTHTPEPTPTPTPEPTPQISEAPAE